MKRSIITVVLTLVVLAGICWLYMISGSYNISQLDHHNALTKWAIKTTKHASIESRSEDIKAPDLTDSTMIHRGFAHYIEMCAGCHGLPGFDQSEITEGLYPKPPKLYKFSDRIDPREAFWVTKNGIKMTSMPAFGPTHDDQKIWDLVAFMNQKLSKMNRDEVKSWAQKYGEREEHEEHDAD